MIDVLYLNIAFLSSVSIQGQRLSVYRVLDCRMKKSGRSSVLTMDDMDGNLTKNCGAQKCVVSFHHKMHDFGAGKSMKLPHGEPNGHSTA